MYRSQFTIAILTKTITEVDDKGVIELKGYCLWDEEHGFEMEWKSGQNLDLFH